MISIAIDPGIREKCPRLILNAIQCRLSVSHDNAQLWLSINQSLRSVREVLHLDDVGKIPAIRNAREAYKALGKDPSRYRLSAEALLRRTIQGKDLYKVNNVIDILNILSIRSGISIGGYDADNIQGDVTLSGPDENEVYDAIGRGLMNICHLPALRDALGYFGNPTSDSVRTSVTDQTTNFLMIFFNFEGNAAIREWLIESISLLTKFAVAEEFSEATYH